MRIAEDTRLFLLELGFTVTENEQGSISVTVDISGEVSRYDRIRQISSQEQAIFTSGSILTFIERKLNSGISINRVSNLFPVTKVNPCEIIDTTPDALLEIPNIPFFEELENDNNDLESDSNLEANSNNNQNGSNPNNNNSNSN